MGSARALALMMALTASPARADEAALADDQAADDRVDWYDSYAHVVRFDLSMGRWTGKDLGAGGIGLQWEWWPRRTFSYAVRSWIQSISVNSAIEGLAPATREASGASIGLQVATPGALRAMAGAGVGLSFVNGNLPPSDRWQLRPVPVAAVVEVHGGVALMAAPLTVSALAWVHVYTEGPPVLSLSIGLGAMVRPGADPS